MRTTVTLEGDVEKMLRDEMHRSRSSFKATLNAALRAGLTDRTKRRKLAPFIVKPRPLGLRPGIDSTSFNKMADELEVEAFLSKASSALK